MHNHVFTERCKRCWSIKPTRGPCEGCNARAVASRAVMQVPASNPLNESVRKVLEEVPHCGVSLRYSAPIGTAVWVKTAGTWLMTKTASEPLESAGRWWVTTQLNKSRPEACEDVFHVVKPGSVPHCGVSIRPDTAIGTRVWCEDNRGVWQPTVTESLPYREGEAPWRVWLRPTWLMQTRHVFYVNAPPLRAMQAEIVQRIRPDLFPDGPIQAELPTGSPVWTYHDYHWQYARTTNRPSFRPDGTGTVGVRLRKGEEVERPIEQIFPMRHFGVVASDAPVGTVVVCMDKGYAGAHLTKIVAKTDLNTVVYGPECVFVEGAVDDRTPVVYPRQNVFYAHRSR